MDDRPRQLIAQLIAQHGTDLYAQPERLKALLLDDLQGTCEAEVDVLLLTLEHGLVQDLLADAGQYPAEVLVSRLTQRLRRKMPLDDSTALWAIESWALALGILQTAPQSGADPAPRPTSGSGAPVPTPGNLELVLSLPDLLVTLRNGDTVRGDVQQTLTIASPLTGRLEVTSQDVIAIDGNTWVFADGTVLNGSLTTEQLELTTSRRVRRLRVEQLKPLRYRSATDMRSPRRGSFVVTLDEDQSIVGQLRGPLTFKTEVETLDLDLDEIVSFAEGSCRLNDATCLTGQFTAPDPLTVQTCYGVVQVPITQVQGLQDHESKSEELRTSSNSSGREILDILLERGEGKADKSEATLEGEGKEVKSEDMILEEKEKEDKSKGVISGFGGLIAFILFIIMAIITWPIIIWPIIIWLKDIILGCGCFSGCGCFIAFILLFIIMAIIIFS